MHYYPLYKENKVGVVFFHSTSKKMVFWDIVVAYVNNWEEIKQKVKELKPPFILEISKRGVEQKHF